jgi:hypothetical protein
VLFPITLFIFCIDKSGLVGLALLELTTPKTARGNKQKISNKIIPVFLLNITLLYQILETKDKFYIFAIL